MKTLDIIKLVQKNGGISLNSQLNNAKINNGYMVSVQKYEYITDIKKTNAIKNRISYIKNILKENEYIGLWYDDNKLYIDLSKNIKKLENAKKTAIKNSQKAIYDICNDDVIYIVK